MGSITKPGSRRNPQDLNNHFPSANGIGYPCCLEVVGDVFSGNLTPRKTFGSKTPQFNASIQSKTI